MKKYLFVIANYNDERQQIFNDFISPRNKKFCENHNYEYIEIKDDQTPFRDNYTWLKFSIVQKWIKNGFLKEGDLILNLDADMSIQMFDDDYPNEKTFSYSIDNGNTHCMGNYSLKINEWGVNLIDNILSENRYLELKDIVTKHDLFGSYSSFWNDFREQASWYSLAGIKRHSQIPFFNLPDYGWHSDKNENTVYTLEELYNNVQILPTEWNVTIMNGESNGQLFPWYINKTKKEDIKIRHFAAGTEWLKEYL